MITSRSDYQKFVLGLNFGNHPKVMSRSELVMHLSLDSQAMMPSVAKQTIDTLLHDGMIAQSGNNIDLSNLYDDSKGHYVMKGQSGKTLKTKPGTTGIRHTKYIAPGHTQISYAHRVLDIRFKESPKQFKQRQHLRRVKAAKNRKPKDDTVYLDYDEYGQLSYVSKHGTSVNARSRADKGNDAIIKKNLKRDSYTIEEMRALLRDDHWEEVAGNKRWAYDKPTTVKEFKKYLRTRKG